MQETAPIELSKFIENELCAKWFPNFSKTERMQRMAWRITGARSWRKSQLGLAALLRSMLPGRFKPAELQHKLQSFLDSELDRVFQNNGLYEAPLLLFGKPFSPISKKYKDLLTALRLVNEIVLEDEYHVSKLVREDAVVVDAGANIGTFAVFAASRAPKGSVYAFEPTRCSYDVLSENVRPYSNINAVWSALGARSGETELFIHDSTGVGNWVAGAHHGLSSQGKEKVPLTTVDEFVRAQGLSRVDFIRIDTEGFEKEILEGAEVTIRAYHPVLAFSAYHKEGDSERLRKQVLDYCPEYQCTLKKSPELDLICTVGT